MKKILAIVSLLSVSLSAQAGTANGKVTSISIDNASHIILFELDSKIPKIEGTPRSNEKNLFALDMRKAGGDVMYKALLEAKAHQYVLTVTGLNTCILQVGAEGVKYLELK